MSCERAAELAANTKGICFIRTSRPNTAVIYENDEAFAIGKAKVVLSHEEDDMLVIGAGVTLHEALKAAGQLEAAGIKIAVLDPFTVKPIDQETLIREAHRCKGRVLTVEDHYPEGISTFIHIFLIFHGSNVLFQVDWVKLWLLL